MKSTVINHEHDTHKHISSFFLSDKGYPHSLIELSKNEANDLRSNTIHLSGLSYSNKLMTYATTNTFGKKLNVTAMTDTIDGQRTDYTRINLSKTKNRIIAITTDSSEVLKLRPNTIIIQSSKRYISKKKSASMSNGSGILLLYLAILPVKEKKYSIPLDREFATLLKKTKNNIMKKGKSNHHDSSGYYYSFWNKGSFQRKGNKSVDQYANKTSKSVMRMQKLNEDASEIEHVCASHISESVLGMENVIRNISKLLSPVIDTAFEMQKDYGQVGLKDVESSESGMWQSSMCVNARTRILHTEEDCTYTLCKVPSQITND